MSHVVTHMDALQVMSTNSDSDKEETAHSTATSTVTVAADMCNICLLVPHAAVALVPCGHHRFACHVLTLRQPWTAAVQYAACQFERHEALLRQTTQ